MISAIFWYIIPPIQSMWGFVLPYSVVFQELIRWGFIAFYFAAEKGFASRANVRISLRLADGVLSSIASGLGFGLAYALVMYVSILMQAVGPGDLYIEACPHVSFFFTSAMYSFAFLLLHVFTMVIAFDGYKRKGW
eukprot:CAMPEP_0184645270 /NCGR_PEP_ID=MMETSP0308-20130426/1765_1 /TAXON_ID=38269 /ORGANISM="Gloeochaete witrockiana, Strain SAG 46.84" /LENGTH=135 /DNA_ID=CAMNT_0027074151 /DNA_START=288 /DNA_END=692 /DNA_ORIENTATION=+